jgi:serine/threonine protein kinase
MKKIFNNSKSANYHHHHQPNEQIQTTSISQTYSHFIGKSFQMSKHSVCIEDIIAEGGFSVVFLVRSNQNGKKYALKRMYVNNEQDLEACKLEIQICKTLSEHNKYILKYIDSSIQRQSSDIYEILLLTKYCKLGGVVQLMNDRLVNSPIQRLTENEILKIFCDTCEAVADLHAHELIHRDLKIENILIDDQIVANEHARSSSKDKKSNLNNSINNNNNNSNNQRQLNFVLCDFGSATKHVFDRNSKSNSSSQNVQLVADEIQKY